MTSRRQFVRQIFGKFLRGVGVRAIAQSLTDEGLPSPSAHDPARNLHRDPRGWAFSAVRAILLNESYTGRRVWAKQRKVEELIDPDDVAAGNQTRLRWRPEEEWVRPDQRTHEALVSDDVYLAARGRLASGERGSRKPRTSVHAYPLRGILYCSICGRRMEGTWHATKDGVDGRALYRCAVRRHRALIDDFPNHPSTLYVREDAILAPLDNWIATITSPEALASHQPSSPRPSANDALLAKLADVDRKISALMRQWRPGRTCLN
jgi:hypothetical protein